MKTSIKYQIVNILGSVLHDHACQWELTAPAPAKHGYVRLHYGDKHSINYINRTVVSELSVLGGGALFFYWSFVVASGEYMHVNTGMKVRQHSRLS